MSIDFDVVVLGGGAAGCAAAISAAQNGARVCVVAGPPGASALFSGAWRGPCPDGLRAALAAAGYELVPCEQPLPHPTGTVVACSLATSSHASAQLTGTVLVLGVAGLPGFNATALAREWSAHTEANLTADIVTIAETPAAGWAYAALAGHVARNPDVLFRGRARRGVDRVVVPAILGMQHDAALHARVQEAAGCVVGEALAVPPSLPGWRMHNALQHVLERAGITTKSAKVIAAARRGSRVDEVELMTGEVIRARAFVLATGKYVAGGIEADGEFREPVFDCPVWVEHLGEHFDTTDPLILTDPDFAEDQPLLRAGVHAQGDHRPVDRSGDVVYENVFVAGSIRAGWTSATCGIGDAAEDGWYAGLKAVSA